MELFSIPNLQKIAVYASPVTGAPLLSQNKAAELSPTLLADSTPWPLSILEVRISMLGIQRPKPYLLAILSNGSLVAYQGFLAETREHEEELRFSRLSLPLSVMELLPEDTPHFGSCGHSRLLVLDRFGGPRKSGFFVCGERPAWLAVQRGQLRAYPFSYEGAIHACTPFNAANCEYGILYFNEQTAALKLAKLPEGLSLELPIPVERIPLRCTVHQVIYDPHSQMYVLFTSTPVPYKPAPKPEEDGETPAAEDSDDEDELHPRATVAMVPKFEIKLVSPLSWKVLDSFALQESEHALCGCSITLRDLTLPRNGASASLSHRHHVAVGTAITHGEEAAVKGRILLFEIAKQAIDNTQENGQLTLFWEKSHRGPASAMADLEGHLIVAVGPKLLVHRWSHDTEDLVPCAFHDAQIYICTIRTMKNFIILGDIFKSIHFFVWKDFSPRTLEHLGSDFSQLEVFACEFLACDKHVSFIVSDARRNIR